MFDWSLKIIAIMVYQSLILCLFLINLQLTEPIYGQTTAPLFRSDYTYSETTKSFYKFHPEKLTWLSAKRKCLLEGAMLFYPEDELEAETVKDIWSITEPLVFIGISDLLWKGNFETIDGKPIDNVYNNWDSDEPNDKNGEEDCVIMRDHGALNDDQCSKEYPFICKKTLQTVQWNALCELPDPGYKYAHALGKCYKFHLYPRNWTDAYDVCQGEQSYLAVPNSRIEADYLVNLTAESPKDKVKGKYVSGAVHLGFHKTNDSGWENVQKVKLEESGYATWGNKQPDGGEKDQCGSMYYNGRLNDLGCHRKCFFICEHDIASKDFAVDERILPSLS